jgi:sensor histidine kinase YesM
MNRLFASDRLRLVGALACVAGALYLLLYGIAGDRSAMQLLPSADVRLATLADPAVRLTWPAVLDQPTAAWQPRTSDYYIQAFNGGAVWVRATFRNPTAASLTGVLADEELILDHLDCWTPDPAAPSGWHHQTTGERVPGALKPIWGRDAAVYITVPAHSETVAYLRAHDKLNTWFRAVWWPEARAFHAAQLRGLIAESLYFGILLALFVYNGLLWLRLRHRDLGFYLGYLASVAAFMVISRSLPMLVGWPIGSPRLEPLSTLTLSFSSIFMVQFAREFLTLRAVAPRLDRLARLLGGINVVFALGAPTLFWSETSAWMHLVVPGVMVTQLTLLVLAALAWRSGVPPARFFILCFGCFLLGALPFCLRWLLAIPLGQTMLMLMLGSALEMLLLSLAIADRFARVERSRHAAQLAEERAHLESLRYQLNPHFLFNALNSIYALVYPHSAAAGDVVRRLADFCRDTLTRPSGQWQTLGDELAMLRNYLGIEQARWRDSLVVEFDFDPAADAYPLPPFLLLPLVDNAIKHGGATSPDTLTVRLATRRESNGAVTLTIANTGHWLATDRPRPPTSTGVGLENIRARLHHAFNGQSAFTTTAATGWVTVTLRLPPPSAINRA